MAAVTSAPFLPRRLDQAFKRMGARSAADRSLFAASLSNPAYTAYFDDFIGQTAGTWPASANWGYPATVGTNTEVIGIKAGAVGGQLSIATAGASNDSAYQAVGLHWNGTRNFYYIAKFQIDIITTLKFEAGMVDSITTNGAVNAKATPTFNMTTGAVVIFDTSDDTNISFITAHGGTVGANVDHAQVSLVAATDIIVEIVGSGGTATGYVNGIPFPGGGGAITAATALTPYIGITTRSAEVKTMLVDYMGAIGPRG